MLHCANVNQILDVLEVTSLCAIEHVEPTLLDQLPHQLQCDLIAPLVHEWHAHVIDEDRHHFALRRSEILADLEIAFGINCRLEHRWLRR
jgi:hypothetical protein